MTVTADDYVLFMYQFDAGHKKNGLIYRTILQLYLLRTGPLPQKRI